MKKRTLANTGAPPWSLHAGRVLKGLTALAMALLLTTAPGRADETCQSPYMPKITGHEEYIYVWTLGVEGLGDGSDKVVTLDARPGSTTYGQVIHTVSVGGRHEAHHGGFTDDRRQLWMAGLDTSHIFIFDVATDPARPRLMKTIDNFEKVTGAAGPHGMYALPGRVLIPCLSNAKSRGGQTAIVEYSNQGEHIATHWMPVAGCSSTIDPQGVADGYGYDARVLPRKNVMLSSSFTGWKNYMREFGELAQDADAMKHFGQTMVLWNFHTRQPRQVFHVPGAPLEIRWAWGTNHNYAFTATALTSKLWLIFENEAGQWKAEEVAQVGPEGGVLPVDISLSADDGTLFVDSFGDGVCRVYDVRDPHHPRLIHEKKIGRQVNMVSQSWDGRRCYFTSSLLAHWDKKGEDNEQFLKAYEWDGKELKAAFAVDFTKEGLGRPHLMRFGSSSLYQ